MSNINADAVQNLQRMLKRIQWVVNNLQDSPKSFMQNVTEIMQEYPKVAAPFTPPKPTSPEVFANPNRYRPLAGAVLAVLEVKVQLDTVPGAWHEISDFHKWFFQNSYVQEISEKGRYILKYSVDTGLFKEEPI